MDTKQVVENAEQILHGAVDALTLPRNGECLACYLERQISAFGCDGSHRCTERYRDLMAPRATALLQRLSAMGACCCSCEVLMNAYIPASWLVTPGYWSEHPDGYSVWVETEWPVQMPPCAGVRRGSTQACGNWQRVPRPRRRFW